MALNDIELKLVDKFRTKVEEFVPPEKLQDDHFLIRWLRARDMDMEKAKCMLQKSLEWSEKNQIDKILDQKPATNYYRFAMAGHDADGCPVFIMPIGLWKLHEVTGKFELDLMHHWFLRILARAEQEIKMASQQFGKPVTQATMIVDYEQTAYLRCGRNIAMVQTGLEVAKEFEANFPESLKCAIFINTARMFPLVYKLIKPIMSQKTMNKMEVHSSQRKTWISALEAKIPMEILPPHYGGTRPGNDEYCSNDTTLWNDGEPLPAHYYQGIRASGRRRKSSILDLDSQFQNTVNGTESWIKKEIMAGEQHEVQFVVSQGLSDSSTLNWEIKSEAYDIGMKITFKPEDEERIDDLVKYSRIDCNLTPVDGSLICQEPGVYTLILDNSYSLTRSKKVSYKVELTENFKRRLTTRFSHD